MAVPEGTAPAVDVRLAVSGDFEITGAYEIFAEKQADPAGSIGPWMQILGGASPEVFASIARLLLPVNSPAEPSINVLAPCASSRTKLPTPVFSVSTCQLTFAGLEE